MTQIATKTATVDGTVFTMGAAASGDTAECGDDLALLVTNGDSSPHTLTIAIPGELESSEAYPDKAYVIANGTSQIIPLLPLFKDPTDGLAHLSWSATTSMTRAVVKV